MKLSLISSLPNTPIGDGLVLPPEFTARFEFPAEGGKPGEHTVELDVAVERGVPVCNEIRVLRNPELASLGGSDLRRIPLANWLAFACANAAKRAERSGTKVSFSDAGAEDANRVFDAVASPARRRKVTDELLREVAAWIADGYPPSEIEAQFRVSRPTAFRYIKEARKRGFLPEEA